jgi:flagellar operon protein
MTIKDFNNLPAINRTALADGTSSAVRDNASKGTETTKFSDFLAKEQALAGSSESHGIHFSGHAKKRISERNLEVDSDEFLKLRSAMDKLKVKGGNDSLVVTSKAAYIVDVKNNTVVTALDKEQMSENVFTKIDSTMFIN